MSGGLPSATRNIIAGTVSTVAAANTLARAQVAAYLIDLSDQFQVTR